MRLDDDLASLAQRQAGCFHRDQALQAGFSRAAVESRLARKLWVPVHPRVYRAATTSVTPATQGFSAGLYVGEPYAFSFVTGARLRGMDPFLIDPRTWVAVPHERVVAGRPLLRVRRTKHFHPWVQADCHGLPVFSEARLVVDLAQLLDPPELRRLVYDLIRRERCTPEEILAAAEGMGGRAGLADLRRVMQDFDPLAESAAEQEANERLQDCGIFLDRQVELWSEFGLVARFDFADTALKVAFEIDGDRDHSSARRVHYDKQRDRATARHGWQVARFPVTFVRRHGSQFVREVRDLLASRQLPPAA